MVKWKTSGIWQNLCTFNSPPTGHDRASQRMRRKVNFYIFPSRLLYTAACLPAMYKHIKHHKEKQVNRTFFMLEIFWAPPTEKWVKKGKVEWFLNSLASVFVLYVTSEACICDCVHEKESEKVFHHSTASATTKAMKFLSLHHRIFSSFLFLMLRTRLHTQMCVSTY